MAEHRCKNILGGSVKTKSLRARAFHWRLSSKYLNTICAHTSQHSLGVHSLGVQQCCALIMHHVIFSNLGLTNPPMFLIQAETKGLLGCGEWIALFTMDGSC